MLPLHDQNRPLTRPYVNYVLISVNVVAFFFFFAGGWEFLVEGFYTYGAIPAEVLKGERPWSLFTSMFMHGDIVHLAGNMLYLWVFGDNIEDSLGHAKYLLFYLLGGLFSSFSHIASTLISPYTSLIQHFTPDLDIPLLGASGAISAVLGAYILLYPRARIRTLVFLLYIITTANVAAYYYLGFWFAYQLLMGLGSMFGVPSTVAFWAHIGGFIYGMAIVKFLAVKPRVKPTLVQGERPVRPITAPLVITPLVDVLVEGDRVIVLANMPGIEERDIRVRVSEWAAEISAEFQDIRFYREVAFPVMVIPKVQNLMFRNGVLSFTLYRAV